MSDATDAAGAERREAFSVRRGVELSVWQGLARIVAFCLLVGALALSMDCVVSAGLRKISTSSFGVWNRIVDGTIDADVLVTGSSRALNHYDPRVIREETGASAFNIGLNGSQIDMQVARLRTYLAHNRPPRLVVHNLDLFTFQVTHKEVYDPGQYVPYIDEPFLYRALTQIDPGTWKVRYMPLYGYVVQDLRFTWIKGIAALLGKEPSEDHVLGFNPRYQAWTGDFERFRKANAEGIRVAIEPQGVRELEELIQLCGEHGIRLVLVYSPEYRDMQDLTTNRAEVFNTFHEVADRFAVPVWDYSDSDESSERTDFYNSQHLNAGGAEKFSKSLASRLAVEWQSIPVPKGFSKGALRSY